MIRTTAKMITGFLMLLMLSLHLASCSGGGIDADVSAGPSESPLPDDAYSHSLPEGATLITEDEFASRLESDDIFVVSAKTERDQEEQAVAQEESDDATIADFIKGNPGISLPFLNPPAVDDPTIVPLEDGNYLHTVDLKSGDKHKVVTMGPRFVKHQFAEAIRKFGTFDNQLNMYGKFYDRLPLEWKRSLELIDPEIIANNPDSYTIKDIMKFNDSIAIKVPDIIADAKIDLPFPEGYVSDCTKEIGYGNGSDSQGSSYTDPNCGFQANGIQKNYEWPMKYYATCVKDQLGRGTCVSFANTSAIEMDVAKKHGLWVNLSEQAYYNRMKFDWERWDYGDGFVSETGFSRMIQDGWLIPFENQWPYNPSPDRFTGEWWCTNSNCEQNSTTFQQCVNTCGTSFAVGSQNYNDCIQQTCRENSIPYQTCKTSCEDDVRNHKYYNSCLNYADTCSESTHQSELVCASSGSAQGNAWYNCAYSVPNKNPNHYGYRITTAAQIWDASKVDLSLGKVLLALFLGDPVVIGLPVTTAFDAAADDGFMAYVVGDTNRGGHGLHAVGYIDNDDLADILPGAPAGSGGGYLIVKNSWSNCWGDGGYIYMPYEVAKEYISDATVLYGVQ